MKVYYKQLEVANTNKSYNVLSNKPYLNGVEIIGNVTLNDIDVYDKDTVDELFAAARAVKVELNYPTDPVANTMYYIGPQADGSYEIYLSDSTATMVDLGSSSLAEYVSGNGINVDTTNNTISAKLGNNMYFDSEGNICTSFVDSIDALSTDLTAVTAKGVYSFVMTGASSSTNGERGLVPAPSAGDQDKYLKGDGSWDIIPTVIVSDSDPVGGSNGDIWIKNIYE